MSPVDSLVEGGVKEVVAGAVVVHTAAHTVDHHHSTLDSRCPESGRSNCQPRPWLLDFGIGTRSQAINRFQLTTDAWMNLLMDAQSRHRGEKKPGKKEEKRKTKASSMKLDGNAPGQQGGARGYALGEPEPKGAMGFSASDVQLLAGW